MDQPVSYENTQPEEPAPSGYPPKYMPETGKEQVWLRSVLSLAAYLVMGYYFFPGYKTLLVITAIVMIHELGHFIAMKAYRYNELGIFFIPLLGAYVSGNKREVSQQQSAIILLAGPLPGILIGTLLYLLDQEQQLYFLQLSLSKIGILFILLNLLNLLPVYPLDGGQLLNRVFLDEESIWSRIFVILSTGLFAFFAWNMYRNSGNPFYFVLLFFPLTIVLRSWGDKKMNSIEKKIEEAGINADVEYEDLPDADYWKIRNILIEEHPAFSTVMPSPPYQYCEKEDKIMVTIQGLLHRHLIQDLTIAGKLLIFLIWAAGIATPWLLNIDLSLFNRFR